MKTFDVVTFVLVLVGAVNWGLVGLAQFDLVAALFGMQFGETSALTSIVYGLVGVSGLYQVATLGRRTRVIAATALVALATTVTPMRAAEKDIVDTAVAAGQFKTLAAALQAAGLVESLKGTGPFTVFAPTDEAFAKLPAGTVENLLKPENRDKLRAILTYHVVAGKVTAAQVMKMKTGKTVQGQDVRITAADGSVKVNDAKVVKADIAASNGVIHVIDTVIMPK